MSQIIVDTKGYKPQEDDVLCWNEKEKKFDFKQASLLFKKQNDLIIKLSLKVAELEDVVIEYQKDINKKVNALAKSTNTLLGD